MSKTILFVNSGSRIKEFTLKKAKELGLKLALVKSEMSWEKPYVDYFINADTYNHKEVLAEVERFNKVQPIDGVVTFWERDVVLAAKITKVLGLPGCPVETAQRARDKFLMAEAFRCRLVPHPRTFRINSYGDLYDGVKIIKTPAVLKPVSGAASKNVVKIVDDTPRKLLKLYQELCSLTQPGRDPLFHYNPGQFVLQEYMDGPEVSVEGIVKRGEIHLVAIHDKAPMTEPYFIEAGNNIPSRYSDKLQKEIYRVAEEGINALGYDNCGVHAEIKITKTGPRIVEIAARLGGDYICNLVEEVYGIDLVKSVIKIALGEDFEFQKRPPECYLSARYFIPDKMGYLKKVEGLNPLKTLPYVYDARLLYKVGEKINTPPDGYDYLGWVIARSSTLARSDYLAEILLKKVKISVGG